MRLWLVIMQPSFTNSKVLTLFGMTTCPALGQLLRHKYGGFYRLIHVVFNEPVKPNDFSWPKQIVLKHVWPFEQANQTRDVKDIYKFEPVSEDILNETMMAYSTAQYQQQVSEAKQYHKEITEKYQRAQLQK